MVQTAELGNLLIGAGLLVRKLVARETDDYKTLVLILLVEGLEAVVLGSETALGGGVDNQEDLALVLAEIHLGALVVQGLEVIDRGHEKKC